MGRIQIEADFNHEAVSLPCDPERLRNTLRRMMRDGLGRKGCPASSIIEEITPTATGEHWVFSGEPDEFIAGYIDALNSACATATDHLEQLTRVGNAKLAS